MNPILRRAIVHFTDTESQPNMKKTIQRLTITTALLCLCGCASSSIKQSWKSPAYSGGPVQKVAVVARRERAKVQLEMRVGLPATEIARMADSLGAGEIVMGTRGMGGVKGLFMGSVAMKVVHLSKCPVTLVK